MLFDTYGLVYRAFFALPPLTTSRGVPINAAYGFTMMMNKIIADERPTHVIAAFDKGMPAHRVALYHAYKAQRDQMPADLRGQFALVRQILGTFRIPILEIEGEEADDVIATLARDAAAAGHRALVVTGDLDLLQIVDERTTVLMTRRGITELARYDPGAVNERFGLAPPQLPDYRGLKGDPSDNLPGIPGVGDKTATKLIQSAGSLDELVAHPERAGTPKLAKLIEEFGAQAQVCRDVSKVKTALDVASDWAASRYTPTTNGELYRLYSELEFKSLLSKLDVSAEMPLFVTDERLSGNYRTYVPATDPPEYAELAREIERFLRLGLRAEGRLQRGEAGFELIVAAALLQVGLVHLLQEIELAALGAARQMAVGDILDDVLRIDAGVVNMRALVDARQKAVAPQLRADDWLSRTEDNVTGQVLVLRTEAVGQPGTEARPRRLRLAGVHHQKRRLVVGRVGVHRADDADVVNAAGDVRKQLADFDAALAVFLGFERRRKRRSRLAFSGAMNARQRLAGVLIQEWLGVERIDLRHAAVPKQKDQPIGFGRELRLLWRQWIDCIRPRLFMQSALETVMLSDLISGLAKTPIFGFIIAIVGCHFGLSTRGGTEGVGQSTTRTVVTASISILVVDYVVTQFLLTIFA